MFSANLFLYHLEGVSFRKGRYWNVLQLNKWTSFFQQILWAMSYSIHSCESISCSTSICLRYFSATEKIDTLGWNTSKTNWCQISYCEEFNSLEYNSAVKGHYPFGFALWWKICSPLYVVTAGFHLSRFLFRFWFKWSFVIWNLPDHQWLF